MKMTTKKAKSKKVTHSRNRVPNSPGHIALTINCPKCGAPAGVLCRTIWGDRSTELHALRISRQKEAAEKAKLPEAMSDPITAAPPKEADDRLTL
jgi:hypothetical protein